jgi:D-alanyl-D-alanine carboxypeptidase/D-alanyl-D-alanine-endopeptidase (penicillin-binding protein 4)
MLFFGNNAYGDESSFLSQNYPATARWGLVAVDLNTGKELVQLGNSLAEPLAPGSLVKLFIAGALLDHRQAAKGLALNTTIFRDGVIQEGTLFGNLYIKGRGNALLTSTDLKRVVNKVAELGIRRISGNIIADDGFFEVNGLERSRTGAGYAPVGALGLDLHTVGVTVTSTESGKAPLVKVEPTNQAVRVAVSARTTVAANNTLEIVQIDDTSYRVAGNIPLDASPVKQRFSLRETALYTAGVLKAELLQGGIKVTGAVKKGKLPSDANSLAEIPGPDIHALLRDMNVHSLNVMADNLLLLLGAEKYGEPGSREKGLKGLSVFLDSFDLTKDKVVVVDGSGLRDENRVTAGFLTHYLRIVEQKKWFPSFYESLPRCGLDGTAKNIGYRNERFRVKTGRLENAFGLAGYGVDGMGREIAFTYIINVPAGGAMMPLDQIGTEVLRYLAGQH